MRHDAERAGPVFGQGLERFGFHGSSMAPRGTGVMRCRATRCVRYGWRPWSRDHRGGPARRRAPPGVLRHRAGRDPRRPAGRRCIRTWEALRNSVQQPNAYYRTHAPARRRGRPRRRGSDRDRRLDGRQPAPGRSRGQRAAGHRRRGIGRALHDDATARVRARGPVHGLRRGARAGRRSPTRSAAYAFATAVGFETVHVEDHLVLRLPVGRRRWRPLRASAAGRPRGTTSSTWGDRCPDE